LAHDIHDKDEVAEAVTRQNRRAVKDAKDHGSSNKALISLGLGLATAGAAAFFFAKARKEDEWPDGPILSDAPDHVLRGKALEKARNQEPGRALVGRTVTIGKPASELYAFWRAFERFPEFVKVVTRIAEDVPNRTIAWVSEPDSQIDTEGRVEFADAPPGRGTYVRLLIRYTPPAGSIGRLVAKVMQREPNVQARRDLRRFKQLMETGEIPVNASPSGRKSESPTQPRI